MSCCFPGFRLDSRPGVLSPPGSNPQLVGKVSRALGSAIEPTIRNTTKRFFADLARECEVAAKDAGAQA
jgi:hypothetical protein